MAPSDTPDAAGEPAGDDAPVPSGETFVQAGFDALPTQVAILDDEGEIVYTNRAWRSFGEENDLQGEADAIGVNYLAVCRGADDEHAATAIEGIEAVLADERDQFAFEYPCHGPDEQRWFTMRAISFAHGDEEYVLVLHLNITDRKRSEMQVAEQNDELATFNQVNTLVREIIDSLLEGVTRAEIEEAVCARLADSHLYHSAFTVSHALGRDGLRLRAAAGVDGGDAESLVAGLDAADRAAAAVDPAVEDGEVRAVRYLHDDPDLPAAVREFAERGGYRAYAVVPLSYRDTVYGALVVNALRPDAFSDREREAFDVLGETVGYAINAIESKRVLRADTLTELAFVVDDAEDALVAVSTAADCALELEGLVPADEGVTCYLTVEGAPAARVADAAREQTAVRAVRVVTDRDPGGLVEVTLAAPSVLTTLSEYGATVQSARVEAGSARVSVVVSPETEVRDVVETLTRRFPDTELVAKRDTERTVQSIEGFRQELRDSLTDRQREVLEAAHFGGYFRRPRESSGEELAAAFDISAPTFHQHLQAGLHKLTALAFDAPDA